MNYIDLLLRWMHILAAVTLVGGTFFLRFVWFPAYKSVDYRDREKRFGKLRGSWSKLVMLSTLFLLVSGLVNAVNNIKRYEIESTYHMLVGVKLLVALAMFFLSARIAGRSDSAVRFREQIGKWLTINSLLAIVLVAMAGWMKLTPRDPKLPSEDSAAITSAATDPAIPFIADSPELPELPDTPGTPDTPDTPDSSTESQENP